MPLRPYYSTCVCSVTQAWPTLCDPMDCSPPGSSVPGDSPGKDTGVGCHVLLQGILLTPRIEPKSLMFPALTDKFFTSSASWEAPSLFSTGQIQDEWRFRSGLVWFCFLIGIEFKQ